MIAAPPLAAATAVADVLVDLFLVLLAAKLGDELFKRLGQPALVGEILAGVAVGPSVLGLVEPSEALEVFAELGVVFLLFWVGLETRLSEMRAVGRVAAGVGVLGVAVPFAAGFGSGSALGESAETSVFIGAALVATSVGITSAVLIELGALATTAARTILGAAVIDDILAMVLLAVAVGVAEQGGVDVASIAVVVGLAVAFVAFVALGGTRVVARWPEVFHAPRFSESPLLPAVILCLGLAAFAAQIGLAAIIGAFLAGMVCAEMKDRHDFEAEVAPLYAFFPPFFFAFIGLEVDLAAFVDGEVLLGLAGITVLAAITKFLPAWLAARPLGRDDALVVGVGMVPRGEVGIIVAGIGATTGVVADDLFAVIVGMSIATTLLVPPILRRALARGRSPAPG
ncbi:MAG TPA: cation:proton antiporter [Solirubrobacteraceae bacterium]|nr:cation:proton antiporter [Solirubrobacteraceae bacterium]